MNIFEGILLGLVQGLTEFLPVSSSGHLWITETVILQQPANLPLEAFLHVSTLLAVLIFFRQKIWQLLTGMWSQKNGNPEREFIGKLLVATLLTAALGLSLQPFVENSITPVTIAFALLGTGVLILLSDKLKWRAQTDFSWIIAVGVGIAQGIAVLPGISRSGMTIAFLLFCGIARKEAVEISFLLAVPAIIGGAVLLLPELELSQAQTVPLLISGIVAFVAGLFAIWAMLKWVEKYWKYFALWCFIVAIALLIFL